MNLHPISRDYLKIPQHIPIYHQQLSYAPPPMPDNDVEVVAPGPEDIHCTDPQKNYRGVRLTATERREAGEVGRGNPL
jgi:hypothetical protein